jgi:hypothetical protein
MSKNYLNAVSFIKKIINSKEFMQKHRVKLTFFTRSSIKLSFTVLICLILSLSKKAAQLKLDLFFKDYNEYNNTNLSVVASSFFEARLKIKPEAFEDLNRDLIDWYYTNNNTLKKFDKFNVFATDGSYFEIPADAKLKKYFEFKSKSDKTNTVRAGANVIFDVCNNKTVCAILHKYTIWERETFVKMFNDFQKLSVANLPYNLFVFDRGFSSSELVKLIENAGMFYLFRLKKDAFKFVSTLDSDDEIVTHTTYDKVTFTTRVITITLDSGEKVVLMTNIFDETYDIEFFKELYFLRWGVEINYDYLKNKLHIEDFQSLNPQVLFQNFFATIFMANLISLAAEEVNIEIDKQDILLFEKEAAKPHSQKNRKNSLKHRHKANLNYIIGRIAGDFIKSLIHKSCRQAKVLYELFFKQAIKRKIPIRPNRNVLRVFKMKKVDKFFKNIRTHI